MIDVAMKDRSSPDFFEAKYRKEIDPWKFSTDGYELGRYEAVVSSLSGRRFQHGFEPGCSIGVLTERLAACCDAVTAVDFSASAAAEAQRRCAALGNVEVRCASITEGDVKAFDLLVLSEIGYYFSQEDWKKISWTLIDRLPVGGILVAAHWLGHSDDHCISGDQVHEVVLAHPGLRLEFSTRQFTTSTQQMRLDRLVRL